MQFRQLGKTGPQVPVLGFGAWPIGGGMGKVDEKAAVELVRFAIDSGITLIDTAQGYRISESIIGRALKDGYRKRCFLATKVSSEYSPKGIRTAIENSLRALNTDCVDLYQIHNWNPDYPIQESMEAMAQLQKEGKARHIGVSNFSAAQLEQAMKAATFASSQPCYNMFDREIEKSEIPFCMKAGIGILAHSALAKGLLGGRYTQDTRFSSDDERKDFPRFKGETFVQLLAKADRLKEMALDKKLTLPQLAIAWLLRLPAMSCILVGAKNKAQVSEHLGAVGITFSEDELGRIDQILCDTEA